jgi:hypothetical protein
MRSPAAGIKIARSPGVRAVPLGAGRRGKRSWPSMTSPTLFEPMASTTSRTCRAGTP